MQPKMTLEIFSPEFPSLVYSIFGADFSAIFNRFWLRSEQLLPRLELSNCVYWADSRLIESPGRLDG
jgi:hypothetical protein